MDLQTIIKDPDYLGLPDGEKAKVVNYMLQRDDDFKGLPDTEQGKVRQYFIKGIAPEPKTPIQKLAQWDYTGIDNRIAPATEAQKAQVKGGYQSILKPEPIPDPKLQGAEVFTTARQPQQATPQKVSPAIQQAGFVPPLAQDTAGMTPIQQEKPPIDTPYSTSVMKELPSALGQTAWELAKQYGRAAGKGFTVAPRIAGTFASELGKERDPNEELRLGGILKDSAKEAAKTVLGGEWGKFPSDVIMEDYRIPEATDKDFNKVWASNIAAGLLGFAGDIMLNPLAYPGLRSTIFKKTGTAIEAGAEKTAKATRQAVEEAGRIGQEFGNAIREGTLIGTEKLPSTNYNISLMEYWKAPKEVKPLIKAFMTESRPFHKYFRLRVELPPNIMGQLGVPSAIEVTIPETGGINFPAVANLARRMIDNPEVAKAVTPVLQQAFKAVPNGDVLLSTLFGIPSAIVPITKAETPTIPPTGIQPVMPAMPAPTQIDFNPIGLQASREVKPTLPTPAGEQIEIPPSPAEAKRIGMESELQAAERTFQPKFDKVRSAQGIWSLMKGKVYIGSLEDNGFSADVLHKEFGIPYSFWNADPNKSQSLDSWAAENRDKFGIYDEDVPMSNVAIEALKDYAMSRGESDPYKRAITIPEKEGIIDLLGELEGIKQEIRRKYGQEQGTRAVEQIQKEVDIQPSVDVRKRAVEEYDEETIRRAAESLDPDEIEFIRTAISAKQNIPELHRKAVEYLDAQKPTPEQVTTMPEAVTKEPWEMTKEEFNSKAIYQGTSNLTEGKTNWWSDNPEVARNYVNPKYVTRGGKDYRVFVALKSDIPKDYFDSENQFSIVEKAGEGVIQKSLSPEEYWRYFPAIEVSGVRQRAVIPPSELDNPHKYLVQQALSEGKPVPAEALKDYPDLQKPAESAMAAESKAVLTIGDEVTVKGMERPVKIENIRTETDLTGKQYKEYFTKEGWIPEAKIVRKLPPKTEAEALFKTEEAKPTDPAKQAYFDLGKDHALQGRPLRPPMVGREDYIKGYESVKPKEPTAEQARKQMEAQRQAEREVQTLPDEGEMFKEQKPIKEYVAGSGGTGGRITMGEGGVKPFIPGKKEPIKFSTTGGRNIGGLYQKQIGPELITKKLKVYSGLFKYPPTPNGKVAARSVSNLTTIAHETGHFLDLLLAKYPIARSGSVREELIALTKIIHPFEERYIYGVSEKTGKPTKRLDSYSSYRRSRQELFADYIAGYANTPEIAKATAPQFTAIIEEQINAGTETGKAIEYIIEKLRQFNNEFNPLIDYVDALRKIPEFRKEAEQSFERGNALQMFYRHNVGDKLWNLMSSKLDKIGQKKFIKGFFEKGGVPDPVYFATKERLRLMHGQVAKLKEELIEPLEALTPEDKYFVSQSLQNFRVNTEDTQVKRLTETARKELALWGNEARKLGLLNDMVFWNNVGQYYPYFYTSKEFADNKLKFGTTSKAVRTNLKSFKHRLSDEDMVRKGLEAQYGTWPSQLKKVDEIMGGMSEAEIKAEAKAIREKMGLIEKNPEYSLYKRVSSLIQSVYTTKCLNNIARISGVIGRNGQDGYVQMPESASMGALSGQWVERNTAEAINQWSMQSDEITKAIETVTQIWKAVRVPYNPAAVSRNIISNAFLQYMVGDVPIWNPIYASKGIKSFLSKDKIYTALRDNGLYKRTYGSQELQALAGKEESLSGIVEWAVKMFNKPGDVYGAVEDIGKTVIARYVIDNGGTVGQAVDLAQKTLFDYSNVSAITSKLRKFPLPFITFSAKVFPRMVEVAVRKPEKFIVFFLILAALEEYARHRLNMSRAELENLKPPYLKGARLAQPTITLPERKNGEAQFIDLSYFAPWSGWTQMTKTGFPQPFQVGNPFILAYNAYVLGFDPFTGREIAPDYMTKAEQRKAKANYLRYGLMPDLLGGRATERILKVLKSEPDYYGRQTDWKREVLRDLSGVNIVLGGETTTGAANWKREQEREKIERVRPVKLAIIDYYKKPSAEKEQRMIELLGTLNDDERENVMKSALREYMAQSSGMPVYYKMSGKDKLKYEQFLP